MVIPEGTFPLKNVFKEALGPSDLDKLISTHWNPSFYMTFKDSTLMSQVPDLAVFDHWNVEAFLHSDVTERQTRLPLPKSHPASLDVLHSPARMLLIHRTGSTTAYIYNQS